MSKDKQKKVDSPVQELGLTVDDLVKRGARQVIQQAIEAELAELLSGCANVITLHGKRAVVVRNRPLTSEQKATNKAKSKTRVRVEHIFGTQ